MNLAIAEKELGLPIDDEAIEQMKANLVRLSYLIFLSFWFLLSPKLGL